MYALVSVCMYISVSVKVERSSPIPHNSDTLQPLHPLSPLYRYFFLFLFGGVFVMQITGFLQTIPTYYW